MHAHHFCIEFAFASHVLHFLKAQKKKTRRQKNNNQTKKRSRRRRSDIQAPQKQKRNLQTHIENKKKDKCANKKQKN